MEANRKLISLAIVSALCVAADYGSSGGSSSINRGSIQQRNVTAELRAKKKAERQAKKRNRG